MQASTFREPETDPQAQLARVRQLAAAGLAVIPLPRPDGDHDGKRPTFKWAEYQERRPGNAELDGWFGRELRNLAIITGAISGIVVVDADSPQAEQWLVEHLPPTPWRVRTARGAHWYYRHPYTAVGNRVHLEVPGGTIDIRGDGGYVVGPGSVHASGALYAAEGDWSVPKGMLPAFPVDALPERRVRAYDQPVAPSADTPARVLERARAYVTTCDPAVQGQGGDAQTYMVCCRLARGFDLDDYTALDLLRDWNARCVPPWEPHELLEKIRNARKYGDEPIGGRRDQPLPPLPPSAPPVMLAGRALGTGPGGGIHPDRPDAEKEWETKTAPPERPLAEPLEDFMARVALLPDPTWIVPGLIPGGGITMFHGQPRDSKSVAALECLLAVTTLTAPFGIERLLPDQRRRVWYLSEEDPEKPLQIRMACMFKGRGLTTVPKGFAISAQQGVSLDEPEWQSTIAAEVKRANIEVLVLDPLRAITAHADQGPAELKPVVQYLRWLRRETGVSILIIHHDTKPKPGIPDTRRRPQRASGGGLFSIADSPISFECLSEDKRMMVPVGFKFSASPKPITFTLRYDGDGTPKNPTTWMQVVGETTSNTEAALCAKEATILDFLKAHPKAVTDAIKAHVGGKAADALKALNNLLEDRRVDCINLGNRKLWFVPETEETDAD
jgi:hypothetical protein